MVSLYADTVLHTITVCTRAVEQEATRLSPSPSATPIPFSHAQELFEDNGAHSRSLVDTWQAPTV